MPLKSSGQIIEGLWQPENISSLTHCYCQGKIRKLGLFPLSVSDLDQVEGGRGLQRWFANGTLEFVMLTMNKWAGESGEPLCLEFHVTAWQ